MMMLCSNHSSRAFVSEARLTGRLGWLMGPTHFKRPREGIPFALDNDCFIHWKKGGEFNYPRWLGMLDKVKASGFTPLWVLVPDSVGNREATLRMWHRFAPVAKTYNWPLAFALQDGMTPADVPKEASVVFVGGTTSWKWRSAPSWCSSFPRVHIGRVNWITQLWTAQELGAESCDGSGFLREGFTGRRASGLHAWLHLKVNPQRELLLT